MQMQRSVPRWECCWWMLFHIPTFQTIHSSLNIKHLLKNYCLRGKELFLWCNWCCNDKANFTTLPLSFGGKSENLEVCTSLEHWKSVKEATETMYQQIFGHLGSIVPHFKLQWVHHHHDGKLWHVFLKNEKLQHVIIQNSPWFCR